MSRRPPPADFYRAEAYGVEESVGYLMRAVISSMTQSIEKHLEPHGLTHAQWAPLYKLRLGHVSTVAELARVTQSDPGAMTRLLDRLEAKGLCKRVRSTTDRRVVNLELTPEGMAASEKIPEALATVMNEHLAGFSKSEWQALKGYLVRMIDNGVPPRLDCKS